MSSRHTLHCGGRPQPPADSVRTDLSGARAGTNQLSSKQSRQLTAGGLVQRQFAVQNHGKVCRIPEFFCAEAASASGRSLFAIDVFAALCIQAVVDGFGISGYVKIVWSKSGIAGERFEYGDLCGD